MAGWITRLVAAGAAQQRTFDEVQDGLFLDAGNRREKASAFWILLILATVIAAGGVVTNSTATVVGAMIIAPLGTPIFGAALAAAAGYRRRLLGALAFLALGIAVAIGIGMLIGHVAPLRMPLKDNPQITGRTTPTLMDLMVAVATGVAGAYGLTRRDVAAVLPGVAIAISLVPPLAVVGITAGAGDFGLATGALLLFLSNVVAILIAGLAVFTAVGYGRQADGDDPRVRRRAVRAIVLGFVLLLLPLGFASYEVLQYDRWTSATTSATQQWLQGTDWKVASTQVSAGTIVVTVTGRGPIGSLPSLRAAIRRSVPIHVKVELIEQSGADIGL